MNSLKRKHIYFFLTLIIILVAAVIIWAENHPPKSNTALLSGIKGTTVVDGGCTVIREDSPCPDKPLIANITIADANAKTVATTKSNTDGRFQVSLPAGQYTVVATNTSGTLLPTTQPVQVTVKTGEFIELTVSFDSGVR